MEILIKALVKMLAQSGICTVPGLDVDPFPLLKGSMAAVSILSARCVQTMLGGYFGSDAEGNEYCGREFEVVCLVDVYSPTNGQDCWKTADKLLGRLLSGVEGAAFGAAEVGQAQYDPKVGCFRCGVKVPLTMVLYADPA